MTLRIDATQLSAPERTEEGFVRAEGVIAAPGVLEYRTKSGETVRELVPEETLRDPKFLRSLEDKPLTLEHPSEEVRPDNVQDLQVGNADDIEWSEDLERPDDTTGPGVKGTIILRAEEAIEAYENGTLELSPAYEVELEERSGESEYGEYDRVQKKRRAGNHVALTERGRAGSTAMLRADSDAVQLQGDAVSDVDLEPPKGTQEAAQKALDWRDEHGDDVQGGTRTGWTRANQLAAREELSPDVVRRMHSFFERHMAQGNHELDDEHRGEPWRDAGYVAHLLWGGDTGASWATRKAEELERNREDTSQGDDMSKQTTDAETREKVRLDSELSVTVPDDQADKIRRWKEDMDEEKTELSDQVKSAQEEIQGFQEEIEKLKEERDKLQNKIDARKKQLQMLAEKMGLAEMMGGSGQQSDMNGEEQADMYSEGMGSEQADMMSEEKMDSLVTGAIHAQCEARMDALGAAEALGVEVDDETPTGEIKAQVVDTFYDERTPDRMDSAELEARFDVACEEIEVRKEERDESYESASDRADSDKDEPTGREAYEEHVFG